LMLPTHYFIYIVRSTTVDSREIRKFCKRQRHAQRQTIELACPIQTKPINPTQRRRSACRWCTVR
jgi:hypothetical protein